MAGYGYTSRGYTPYNGVGPRSDEWTKTSYDGNGYSGHGPRADEPWTKTSYAGSGYSSDHVCRPVIIDAEGRKRPIISYSTPNHGTESYVTQTETIVEYRSSSPTKVAALKDYGAVNEKWRRPSSPVHDRPEKVEEFLTKVQTEASRPARFGPLSASYWRQTPTPTGHYGNSGYGDYSDYSNKELYKPSGNSNTIRNDNYDDYYRKNDSSMEPTVVTSGGWARPTRSTWAAPPIQEGQLSKPTTDIGSAIEYLKEATKSPSVTAAQPNSMYAVPTVAKRDGYPETIDSRTAAKRYGNFNLGSRPYTTGETYTTTIDSREAARKYHGASVM